MLIAESEWGKRLLKFDSATTPTTIGQDHLRSTRLSNPDR